jgi:hypothetical protein
MCKTGEFSLKARGALVSEGEVSSEADFAIDNVNVVPEPSAFALVLPGSWECFGERA